MRLAVLEYPLREDGRALRVASADRYERLAILSIGVKPCPGFVPPQETAVPHQPQIDSAPRYRDVEAPHVSQKANGASFCFLLVAENSTYC